MHHPHRVTRFLLIAAFVGVAIAATSGCSKFRKDKPRGDYALSQEARPLEVPVDLNLPNTDGSMALPNLNSAPSSRPSTSPATPVATGAIVIASSDIDAVFAQVGAALADIEGVKLNGQSKALSAYDVTYQESSFLVRVAEAGSSVQISAVDLRGVSTTAEMPTRVIALLKQKLGQ